MPISRKKITSLIGVLVFLSIILIFFWLSLLSPETKEFTTDETKRDGVINKTGIFGERVVDRRDAPSLFEPERVEIDGISKIISLEDEDVRLVQLFAGPVAGFSILDEEADLSYKIKLVAQGEGDIYTIQTNPYSAEKDLSLSTLRVQNALILPNETFVVTIQDEFDETKSESILASYNTNGRLILNSLGEGVAAVSKKSSSNIFIVRKKDLGVIGYITNTDETDGRPLVWENGYQSWIPMWGINKNIHLQTKASQLSEGYFYKLTEEGRFEKIFGPENGLLVLHNEKKKYSIVRNADGFYFVNPGGEKIEKQIDTLPEKCVWGEKVAVCAVPKEISIETLSGKNTLIPDSWYQGDISFDDEFYTIDISTGVTKEIKIEQENIPPLDIITPIISDDEKVLFFLNKKDWSLWSLKL